MLFQRQKNFNQQKINSVNTRREKMDDMKLIMENWRKLQESEDQEQINEAPPEYFGADGTDPMAALALSAQYKFKAGDTEGALKDLEDFKAGSTMQGEIASLMIPFGGATKVLRFFKWKPASAFINFVKKISKGRGKPKAPTGAPVKPRNYVAARNKAELDANQIKVAGHNDPRYKFTDTPTSGLSTPKLSAPGTPSLSPTVKAPRIKLKVGKKVDPNAKTGSISRDSADTVVTGPPERLLRKIKNRKTDPQGSK
jgi:hypothetical protein